MELVKRGSVSEEERAEAEKRREELLELVSPIYSMSKGFHGCQSICQIREPFKAHCV